MTEDELARLIDRNSQVETVTTETGIDAGLQLAAVANNAGIQWAFAGGIAMHIYGYVRATTVVDMIAAALLELEIRQLSDNDLQSDFDYADPLVMRGERSKYES